MKVVVLFILIFPGCVLGQYWNERYDFMGVQGQQTNWAIEETENGYVVFHVSYHPIFGTQNIGTTLINIDGNVVQDQFFEHEEYPTYAGWCNSVDKTSQGTFIGGGSVSSEIQKSYLVLYDAEGDTIWTREYADEDITLYNISYSALECSNGDYLLAGIKDQSIETDTVLGLVIRTDLNGDVVWKKQYENEHQFVLYSSYELPFGGFLLSGTTRFVDGNYNMTVLRIEDDGTKLWTHDYGDLGFRDNAPQMVKVTDSYFILCGGQGVEAWGDEDPLKSYFAKIDLDGNVIWEHSYGPLELYTTITVGKPTLDGGYVGAGLQGAASGLVLKVNNEGDSLWMRTYKWNDVGNAFFRDIIPTADGGYIACGVAGPIDDLGLTQDGWVVKMDEFGCVVPGCHLSILESSEIADFMVYPNPASDVVNVYLQANSMRLKGELVLSDISGKVVMRTPTIGGDINLGIDVSEYESGMYLLQFISEDAVLKTERVMVN
jgi:hypothetical protein